MSYYREINRTDLDDALEREAIPAVAWHVLNLRLGTEGRRYSIDDVAHIYNVEPGLIADIEAHARAIVQRSL